MHLHCNALSASLTSPLQSKLTEIDTTWHARFKFLVPIIRWKVEGVLPITWWPTHQTPAWGWIGYSCEYRPITRPSASLVAEPVSCFMYPTPTYLLTWSFQNLTYITHQNLILHIGIRDDSIFERLDWDCQNLVTHLQPSITISSLTLVH